MMNYKKGEKITDNCQFKKGEKYITDNERKTFEFSHIGVNGYPYFQKENHNYLDDEDEYGCIGFDNTTFYEAIEIQKLPETGLVVGEGGDAYIMRTGKSSGYGFRYVGAKNGFVFEISDDWSFESDPNEWDRSATKADEKRWKELLIEEAKKKNYKHGDSFVYGNLNKKGDYPEWSLENNGKWLYHYNYMVFDKGEWAQIIEDEKPKEDSETLKDSGYLDGGFVFDFNSDKLNGEINKLRSFISQKEKEKLLDDSITALKNYLNAGDKEQRRAASVIAKKVIERYNKLNK